MPDQQESQKFSKSPLAVAVSAACAAVPAAHAQQTAIEEIVVTATKRAESIQDVPMSITAFGNDDIVREGFKQLEDYAGRIPALSFGTRHPGGSNVIMRGCAVSGIAFSDNPTTAVYLDEQPITVAGFNPDPRLIDIERVEALSGPQGSLFGDASQCGTLRIITNKPNANEFDGWVDLGASSVAHGDIGYDVSGMVNIPLAADKAAIRLVGFYAEEAGYIDNVLGGSPIGPMFPQDGVSTFDNAEFVAEDVNTATITGGRADLRWHPTDEWTVDFGAIYQKLEEDGFGDTDLPENFLEGRNLGEWEQMRYEEEDFEDEWYQLALTLEGRLGGADVVLATSFLNREYLFRADATTYLQSWQERYPNKFNDGGYYAIYDFFNQNPRAQVFSLGDSDRTSVELRVATPSDSDSRWSGIIGAFYNKTEEHAHFSSNVEDLTLSGYINYYCGAHCYLNYIAFYYNCGTGVDNANECTYPVAPSNNWWTGVYDNTLKQTALFGEASFDISDNFNITLGGRWFNVDIDRRLQQGTLIGELSDYRTLVREANCSVSSGTGTFLNGTEYKIADHCYQDTLSSSSESGFVPKATLTYNFDDNRMIYGTYSEGFRRGGANAAKPRSIFGRPPFNQYDSDLVKNFEIGAKTTLADGRVQFNITAYRMIWEEIQIETEDPTPNLFTLGILNFEEAEIDGIEAFLNWIPSDGWDITANIGINNAELAEAGTLTVEGAPIDRSAEKGTPLPLTPDWKASLSVERYFNNRIWGAEPSFAVGIQHTGDSVNSLAGIQSIEAATAVRNQDAYTLVNLRFGLTGGNWSANLYVNNATDEYAEEFYNARWFQTRLSVNRPRTIGINYRRNFR
jgi:outer membrane receptor protein involved in Fe transport